MAKLSVTRLLDTAKLTATKAGEELRDLVDYVNNTTAEIVRGLRNGLTFSDNFACKVSDYSLRHDTEQNINVDGKTPVGVLVSRVRSTAYGIDAFLWYVNTAGECVVKAKYDPVPSSGDEVQTVTLIVLF